jgi:hypothetical protein
VPPAAIVLTLCICPLHEIVLICVLLLYVPKIEEAEE